MVREKFKVEKHLEFSCKEGSEGFLFWGEGEVK
jgi:hypothetical protein